MERSEFESLRNMPGKIIAGDVVLKRKKVGSVVFESGAVPVLYETSIVANLYVSFNDATDAKTVNVMVVGVGPVCRLDVDDKVHRPAGRCHKHALQTADCPSENLNRNVTDRSDLAGLPPERVFAIFCEMAHIEHSGTFSILT